MKKSIFLFFLATLFCQLSLSQKMGVNVENPTHALHIKPETTNNDPLKIEGMKDFDATGSQPYFLVINPDGVVKKTTQKKGIKKLKKNSTGNGPNIHDLSAEEPLDFYTFDGNYSYTITLPKAVVGARIGFYFWGGGKVGTIIFKGKGPNGVLKNPGGIRNGYTDVGGKWNKYDGGMGELTVKVKDNDITGRHTLYEFICIDPGEWRYIHKYYAEPSNTTSP